MGQLVFNKILLLLFLVLFTCIYWITIQWEYVWGYMAGNSFIQLSSCATWTNVERWNISDSQKVTQWLFTTLHVYWSFEWSMSINNWDFNPYVSWGQIETAGVKNTFLPPVLFVIDQGKFQRSLCSTCCHGYQMILHNYIVCWDIRCFFLSGLCRDIFLLLSDVLISDNCPVVDSSSWSCLHTDLSIVLDTFCLLEWRPLTRDPEGSH